MLYQSRSNSLHSIVEMILSLLLLMIYGIIIIYSKPLDIESDTPLTISFNPSSNQVQLNQPLIIRCEVHSFNNKQLEVNNNNNNNILNGYSMFFQCPIALWGKFCFHNCQSACVGEIPNQCPYDNELSLIKCRTAMTEQGYLFYEYTIPNLTETWLGLNHNNNNNNNTSMDKDNHRNKIEGFSCKTAGLETPKIPLTIVKPNDIQSNIMDLSKTKTSSSSSNSHSMISHLNKTISNEYNTQKDESNPLNNGMNQSIKRINSELKGEYTTQ
ncbi:unnamed protein product [Schistosoma mattheei]|uniref:Uncharacterized protein n=1 Tax=Schistosoma mattheei TaxID=31246 RepID=A0AA85AT67_9TREM|nr:unnamed protein product [Schistosoma mattheei]